MKAIQFNQTGSPEVMHLVEVETPVPSEGQVLIKVATAGINFVDLQQRDGSYPMQLTLPKTPGFEAAGTIVALGKGVSALTVGTRVAVILSAAGGYAEYVVADAGAAIPLPDEIDFKQAVAVVGVQGLTAYFLLHHAASLKRGESVLIHAAAGGVGSIAVQLAFLMGAQTVLGTASSESKLALIRRLGADAAINYTEPDWVEIVLQATGGKGADIILEMASGKIAEQSLQCLAPFGRMVVFGALDIQTQFTRAQVTQLIFQNQAIVGFALQNLLVQPGLVQSALQELMQYVINGEVKIIIEHTFPLGEAVAAHHAMGDRQTMGKVVLLV